MVCLTERDISLQSALPMIRQCLSNGQTFTFRPRGTSMLPMLRQGRDQVTLTAAPEKLRKYDIPLYQRRDGTFVLHRVVKVGACYTCIGDNQYTYEPGICHDQVIGVVCAYTRDGKPRSITSFGYKFYCRWHAYTRPVRHFALRVCRRLRRLFPKGTKNESK